MTLPRVSVVVLNWNGREHLDSCLESLAALDYPEDRLELVLCDNGSTDGSADHVRATFPRFRVVALDRNHGFAVGNNLAAEAATGDWVAFLNNDMRVPEDWLRCLVEPLGGGGPIACVASRIMNWDGTALDFIGGGVNFQGHGLQLDHGEPSSPHDRARRVLFACGGAMLVNRRLFLETGGFDPLYFSYFEDLDLGWRLNLLGHDVVYTPRASVLHRHHGTFGRAPRSRTHMLTERNALFTIFKNYDDANLAAVLPVALLLANEKALVMARVDREAFQLPAMRGGRHRTDLEPAEAAPPPPAEPLRSRIHRTLRSEGPAGVARKAARRLVSGRRVPVRGGGSVFPDLAVSQLVAVSELAHHYGELRERRAWVQERRRRSDAEVLGLERVLLHDPSYGDVGYLGFQRWLRAAAGIEQRFADVRLDPE